MITWPKRPFTSPVTARAYVTGTVLPVDGGLLAGNPARTGGINRLSGQDNEG